MGLCRHVGGGPPPVLPRLPRASACYVLRVLFPLLCPEHRCLLPRNREETKDLAVPRVLS